VRPGSRLAPGGEMDYKSLHATLNKETSMKLILATILAGSFLISLPVKADDKAPSDSKSDKSAKKSDKKSDKKADKGDKGAAPAGGGW
jgi:hypothetical protein